MPATPQSQPEAGAMTRRGSLMAFIFKWTLRAAVVLMITLAIVTQSGVLAWLILPRIESALGCEVEASRVSVNPSGLIVLTDLRLSVPGIDSTAATFLEVPRLEVVPRWSGLLSGTIPVERITAQRPIIRLSQDRNFDLNMAGLSGSGGGSAPDFVPSMDLIDGVLDFGEHGRGWYTPLVSLRVSGQLARSGVGSSRYTFQLSEAAPVAPGKGPEPLSVKGEFDLSLRTGFLTLDHIDLARWQRVAVPERVREIWGQLSLSGEIQGTALSYTPKDGPVVSFSLRDVNMNVPVPAESEEDRTRAAAIGQPFPESALLAMKSVQGDLRFEQRGLIARLDGLIEDLPCTVKLETEGYDPARCGLTCHISAEHFTLEERPRLLPFAPYFVKRNFKRFSGPNGIITGEVTLKRDPAAEGEPPALLRVLGRLDFEKGEAAFEKFAYPFSNMKGTIVFNEEEVRILGITGAGPTGAKLLAHGRVAPPNDQGVVEVDVTVVDAPVDQVLRGAVPERRKNLLELLFSENVLEQLRAEGLAPDDGFALGGDCEIRVAIRRAYGDDSEYQTTIDVTMPRAGLVSAAFPYPAIGEQMQLRITDDDVRLRVPRLLGRGASEMALEADVRLAPPDQPDQFDVRVRAVNLPCDDRLVRALPNKRTENAEHTARSIVGSLGLAGVVDGSARVFSKHGDDIGFEVHASLAGVSSTIGGEGCFVLHDLAGEVVVSDEDIFALNMTGALGDGTFRADLSADRVPITRVSASVDFDALPLHEPVEELVALAAPAQAHRLRDLRATYRPAGGVTGSLALLPIAAGTSFSLDVDRLDRFSATLFRGRMTLADPEGKVRINPERVTFDRFAASVFYESELAGMLTASGELPIDDHAAGALDISLSDGRFESQLVQAAARTLRPGVAARLEPLRLHGAFDLEARITGQADAPMITGRLRPRTLALLRNDTEIRFDQVSGEIRFGPTGGEITGLEALAPGWMIAADGRWSADPSLDIDLSLGFESQGLPADLLAALPAEAGGAFQAVRLDVTGPVSLHDTHLRTTEDGSMLRLTTRAEAGAAALQVGVPVTFASASAELEVNWPMDDSRPPSVTADLSIPEFRARGARLTEGRVRIRSGDEPGAYQVERMAAEMHGGMLTAWAAFEPGSDPSSASRFTATIQAARVDFASLLADVRPPSAESPSIPDAPGSRGEIDAAITITGSLTDPLDRRGRGNLRISGGEVIALPGAMPMLRLSNFQPPLGEPLESATGSFYLQGNTATFESLQASSESLLIVGTGTMTLPETTLDLRFNTQGRGTIPLLDDLLRGLRNELMTTVVSGTLSEPQYRLEAFSGTQRMLGTIFRGNESKLSPTSEAAPDQESK